MLEFQKLLSIYLVLIKKKKTQKEMTGQREHIGLSRWKILCLIDQRHGWFITARKYSSVDTSALLQMQLPIR